MTSGLSETRAHFTEFANEAEECENVPHQQVIDHLTIITTLHISVGIFKPYIELNSTD